VGVSEEVEGPGESADGANGALEERREGRGGGGGRRRGRVERGAIGGRDVADSFGAPGDSARPLGAGGGAGRDGGREGDAFDYTLEGAWFVDQHLLPFLLLGRGGGAVSSLPVIPRGWLAVSGGGGRRGGGREGGWERGCLIAS